MYNFASINPRKAAPAPEATRPTTSPAVIAQVPDQPATLFADPKKAQSLDELRLMIESFDGCDLKKTAQRAVFADGNPEAKVMLIGEAPGAEEDRIGKPFVGAAGQLLDRMLAAISLDRNSAYISNVVFWRPPGNRTPSPVEIESCMPFVRRHIALARPQFLVCLGGVAMKAMFNPDLGIMKMRGQWLDFSADEDLAPIPTLLTYHPSFLLRTPAAKREAWADLQELQKKLAATNADRAA